ncbi:uncharacterized protein LOC120686774 isoform X3 [Panicum virgatum]|uniref:uncharacterized protein LOC120686774 isoform X3 n=1 Tax=Panicum virgatum TaxID=38727 RepID=UPI0019D5E47A|nr:uncharacterized protein LOC120686774 isoform X3 [Panicum virgatum]
MTRGNQRERDRERAAAQKPNAKGPQDGLTPEQRRERDKKALEENAAKRCSRRRPAPPTLHGQQEQGRRQEVGGTGAANACGATSIRLLCRTGRTS